MQLNSPHMLALIVMVCAIAIIMGMHFSFWHSSILMMRISNSLKMNEPLTDMHLKNVIHPCFPNKWMSNCHCVSCDWSFVYTRRYSAVNSIYLLSCTTSLTDFAATRNIQTINLSNVSIVNNKWHGMAFTKFVLQITDKILLLNQLSKCTERER